MHTVLITHSDGCVVLDSVYINDGPPVIDSVSLYNIDCYYEMDGVIQLFPTDSITTSYTWSNGSAQPIIDHLAPGNYSVEVSNLNCIDSLHFTITSPDTLIMNYTVEDISCYGDSNGRIIINSYGGLGNHEYLLDGMIYQDSIIDSILQAQYQLYTIDSVQCHSDTVN